MVLYGNVNASTVGYCNVNLNQDSTWDLRGNIVNPAFRVLLNVNDTVYTASGTFFTAYDSIITFFVTQYSGYLGNQRIASSIYILTDKLTIYLLLVNDEEWRIVLRRL